jgi:hypothetical protein
VAVAVAGVAPTEGPMIGDAQRRTAWTSGTLGATCLAEQAAIVPGTVRARVQSTRTQRPRARGHLCRQSSRWLAARSCRVVFATTWSASQGLGAGRGRVVRVHHC